MFRPYHFLGDNCKDFYSSVLDDLQLVVFNESTLIAACHASDGPSEARPGGQADPFCTCIRSCSPNDVYRILHGKLSQCKYSITNKPSIIPWIQTGTAG